MTKTDQGVAVLRKLLKEMRAPEQGGYPDVANGKFAGAATFISRGLPQATPGELDALFALAGIVPDAIKVNGECSACVHGDAAGGDMGWAEPCCSCSRPKMTNFEPLSGLPRASCRITAMQLQLLENVKARVWWATGLVTTPQFSPEWGRQMAECHEAEDRLVERGMICRTLHGKRLSMKGLLAMRAYRKAHPTSEAILPRINE